LPSIPETCSLISTSNGSSGFLSVQHPGELGMTDKEDATSMENAGTTWPDFKPGMPARPSSAAKTDGAVPLPFSLAGGAQRIKIEKA